MINLIVHKNSLSALHCFISDEARQMWVVVFIGAGLTQLHQAKESFTSFYHHFARTRASVEKSLEEQE